MAATDRQYQDLISGVTDTAISAAHGNLYAPILADLVAIADPQFIAITLDPERENGDPEIVWVDAHTASATTASILRGKEGTTARLHPSGTKLVAGLTKQTVEDLRTATTEDLVPVGAISAYAGSSIPDYWLWCDGSAVSRTTYADLFNIIGTTYGAGDGSTTFNVPNLRGRFPMGRASGTGTGSVLGETGGAIDHTHTGPSHSHTMGTHSHGMGTHVHTMPTHTHTGPSHDHTYSSTTGAGGSHAHFNPNTDSAGGHAHLLDGGATGAAGAHSHSFSDSFTTGTENTSTATAAFGTESPGLAQDNHTHSGSVSGTTSAESDHTHSWGTLDTDVSGAHTHGQNATDSVSNHTHGVGGTTNLSGTGLTGATDPGNTNATDPGNTGFRDPGDTNAAGTGATGAGNPPFLAITYIIKA